MYYRIHQFDFTSVMRKARPNNFTYSGLVALYKYLTEYEEQAEANLELDPIALCCEFSEYKSKLEAIQDLYIDGDPNEIELDIICTFGNGRIIVRNE